MNRIETHGIELAYEVTGEGEQLIVVVPQWFLSSRSMRASALMRDLCKRHRMVFYDRRGTGESDKPGPPYTLGRDTRDLGGLVDGLDLRDLVVLGHGVRGSQVALWYAGHFPERVHAVVCIGGTPRWNAGPEWPYGINDETWETAFGELAVSDAPPAGASIAMQADWDAAGREAAMDILQRTREEDLRPFLTKVTPPTLVLHLRGDGLVPFEAARWLAESLPNGTLEVFDAPREVPLQSHERLAAHIEEWLRSI